MLGTSLVEDFVSSEVKKTVDALAEELACNSGKRFLSFAQDASLAYGYSSILVFLNSLCDFFPSNYLPILNKAILLRIKTILENGQIKDCSLAGGLAGIALAVRLTGSNFANFSQSLDTHLIKNVHSQYIQRINHHIAAGEASSPAYYDIVLGLSGIGNYFLTHYSTKDFEAILSEILNSLVKRTNYISIQKSRVLGYYVQSSDEFLEEDKKRFLLGSINLSFSHGISGVLSFLSKAFMQNQKVPGQLEAIETLADILWKKHSTFEKGVFWTDRLLFEELNSGNPPQRPFVRDAWCYGTAGVCWALFQAGRAIQNPLLIDFAVGAFKDIFKRSPQQWNLTDASFCHGYSGLLALTKMFYLHTQDPFFKEKIIFLEDFILNLFSEDKVFGFFENSSTQELKKQFGLLEGKLGVLFTLGTNEPTTAFSWKDLFII